jgi:centriolar protein POC1
MIVSGSDDKTVKVWDVAERKEINTFFDHIDFVNAVRFHPDGTCIASGSNDKKIKVNFNNDKIDLGY